MLDSTRIESSGIHVSENRTIDRLPRLLPPERRRCRKHKFQYTLVSVTLLVFVVGSVFAVLKFMITERPHLVISVFSFLLFALAGMGAFCVRIRSLATMLYGFSILGLAYLLVSFVFLPAIDVYKIPNRFWLSVWEFSVGGRALDKSGDVIVVENHPRQCVIALIFASVGSIVVLLLSLFYRSIQPALKQLQREFLEVARR